MKVTLDGFIVDIGNTRNYFGVLMENLLKSGYFKDWGGDFKETMIGSRWNWFSMVSSGRFLYLQHWIFRFETQRVLY